MAMAIHFPLYGLVAQVADGKLTPSMIEHPTKGDLFPVFTSEEDAGWWVDAMKNEKLMAVVYKTPREVRGLVSDAAIRGLKNVIIDHIPGRTEGQMLTV